MSDSVNINPQINQISVIQSNNQVTISSLGAQGVAGSTGPQGIPGPAGSGGGGSSSITVTYPIINSGTSSAAIIGLSASYIPASATYSSSAGISGSTSQTDFSTLTLSGSNVATQAYVLANVPTVSSSSLYSASSGSATYATTSGNSSSTSQTNFTTLTLSGSNVATQSYVNSQDILYYASAQSYANSGSLNAYNQASAFSITTANSASSNAYNSASTFAVTAANAASTTAYTNASAFAVTQSNSASLNAYKTASTYALSAANSASLTAYASAVAVSQAYSNSASSNAYNAASAFAVTQSNSASLNAYNTASTLVKTGAWNNTNASVNYATYSGSSNYAITSVVPSDTPPSSPVSSQLWYNTATNRLFVWYVDTDSSQWVEVAGAYTPAFNAIGSDVAPNVDNYYSLGSASMRWKSLNLGASTLYITDGITGSAAGLAISNGVLTINGANQLQVGQLKFVGNNIESTSGSVNIEIGQLSSSADIIMQRDVVLGIGKTLTFPDSTIQTTAYVPGTIAIRTPATGSALTVDLSTDTYVHQHINSGNLSITLTNPTAGRSVELLLAWGNASGGSISINGISGSNLSNGSNGFAITKQFNSIRIYCIDNTFANTFGVVTIS